VDCDAGALKSTLSGLEELIPGVGAIDDDCGCGSTR
jgi:hypothetical protein